MDVVFVASPRFLRDGVDHAVEIVKRAIETSARADLRAPRRSCTTSSWSTTCAGVLDDRRAGRGAGRAGR
ncbi:MAG: hypothetical protein U1F20_09640 [Lysobacterales bacterium]